MSDRSKTNPELIKEVSVLKQKLQELKQEEAKHKHMEKKLRASQASLVYNARLLEAQSEASLDGILVVDNEGHVILSNKRFGEIWRIPQSILDSKDDKKVLEYGLKQLKYPEEFSRRVAYLYENKTEKSRDDIEFVDGRYLDRYSAPMISGDGKYLGRIWFFRDISERKQAEEDLHRMNSFLNSILENIPDMIFLKDAKALRFVRFNRAGEDLLGYDRDELIGKNDYDFFPKEQADSFTEKDHAVLSGRVVVDIPEESIKTRDKGVRTIHTKKVPILDKKGEPEYLLGISEDITERKQAEMQLIMREEELQAKTINLEELNVALRVLLEHREKDKDELQDNIMANVQQLLVPLIEKLKVCPLGGKEAAYVNALEYALQNIVSPFVNRLAYKNWNFTPKEIQVSSLIKDGKSTKEIAGLLNLSIRAVDFHRDNIRKKLGLNKQNKNLRSYLMTLS